MQLKQTPVKTSQKENAGEAARETGFVRLRMKLLRKTLQAKSVYKIRQKAKSFILKLAENWSYEDYVVTLASVRVRVITVRDSHRGYLHEVRYPGQERNVGKGGRR